MNKIFLLSFYYFLIHFHKILILTLVYRTITNLILKLEKKLQTRPIAHYILIVLASAIKNLKTILPYLILKISIIQKPFTLHHHGLASSITSKHYKAKKGAYLLNNSEIREEIRRYPQSKSVLDDYTKWKRLSFISLGMALAGPIFFSSVEVGMLL